MGGVLVEVIVVLDLSKQVFYVQSIFCWVLSCIGFYSQVWFEELF